MKVIYTDLDDKTSQVYDDLEVNYIDINEFIYYENSAKVNVKIEDSMIYINRNDEVKTKLMFSLNKRTQCTIESAEGNFIMESYTENIYRDETRLSIVYRLLQNQQVVAYRSVDFIFIT